MAFHSLLMIHEDPPGMPPSLVQFTRLRARSLLSPPPPPVSPPELNFPPQLKHSPERPDRAAVQAQYLNWRDDALHPFSLVDSWDIQCISFQSDPSTALLSLRGSIMSISPLDPFSPPSPHYSHTAPQLPHSTYSSFSPYHYLPPTQRISIFTPAASLCFLD